MTDPVKAYGLKSGSRKRKKGEDPAAFIARIVKTAPALFAKCDGDLPAVALIYGVQLEMMEDIVAANRKKLSPPLSKARAMVAARKHQTQEEAEAVKRTLVANTTEKDTRLKRKSWPVDEDKRQADIHDALVVSLVENEGDIAEVSLCLSVPIHEILEMLDNDEQLMEARDLGVQVKVIKTESRLYGSADQSNTTAMKMVLTNLAGDRWSERQNVNITRSGFAPPDEKEDAEVSVLKLIKGDNDDA